MFKPPRFNHSSSRPIAAIVTLVLLVSVHIDGARGAEPLLRVGTSLVDITPQQLPVSMTGSFADRQATQVHDPLHARCLVIDDGQAKVALLVCDCCLVSRELFDEAKRRASAASGIRTDHMLMSATHTHTAVTVMDLADCHADVKYNEFFVARLAEAVVKANERLQPAKIGWGVQRLPGEVHNRRWHVKPAGIAPDPFGRTNDRVRTNPPVASPDLLEPAGPTDPDVTVLVAQDLNGRPLAVWANYALHYVGGIPRDSLSADYFGEFGRIVGEKLTRDPAKPCLGLLTNAASGDVNNIHFREKQPAKGLFEQVRHVAGEVYQAADTAQRTLKFSSNVTVAAAEIDLPLKVRKPNPFELDRARERLAELVDPKTSVVPRVYAQEQLELAKFPVEVPVKVQAIRIGGLALVAIPGEPFCQIGLDIKQASPIGTTTIVSLANGYHGYIPTPEQHALGGYETWLCRWSYLEVEASKKITAAAGELLGKVANDPRRGEADSDVIALPSIKTANYNDGGAFEVNDKPFFPILLYDVPTDSVTLAQLREYGFNVIACHAEAVEKLQTEGFYAAVHGRKPVEHLSHVLFGIGMDSPALNFKKNILQQTAEANAKVAAVVPKRPIMNAIGYWEDEPAGVFDGKLPSHEKYEDLVAAIDVAAPYLYPVPYQPVASVGQAVTRAREATGGKKPILPILQLFAWKPEDRYPTPAELRCMTFLSLVEGAHGIGYYSYGTVTGHPKKTISEVQPELWKSVKELNREVAEIGPRLLAGKPTQVVEFMSATLSPQLRDRSKRTDLKEVLDPPNLKPSVSFKVVEEDQRALAILVNASGRDLRLGLEIGITSTDHPWTINGKPVDIKPGRHFIELEAFGVAILRQVRKP